MWQRAFKLKNPLKRSILVVKIGGSGGSKRGKKGLEKGIARGDQGPVALDQRKKGGMGIDCEKEEKNGENYGLRNRLRFGELNPGFQMEWRIQVIERETSVEGTLEYGALGKDEGYRIHKSSQIALTE